MDQAENEGGNASFTCQATGKPVPTISWYFSGVLVNESDIVMYSISMSSLNSTSTLTIINVESADVGTYTCHATNVISTDTSSGVLTVNGELLYSYSFYLLFVIYTFCFNSWVKNHSTNRWTKL